MGMEPGTNDKIVATANGELPFLEWSWEPDQDESPEHSVFLPPYWIDQTEVTNSMFTEFLNDQGDQEQTGIPWFKETSMHAHISFDDEVGLWRINPGYEDHPVVSVNWYGARAYCMWAGRRLPTEAEWEKAARGTDGRRFPWGNDRPNCEIANFDGKCFLRVSTEVGSYPNGASPYGAMDMSGNVWEWVNDWYDAEYYSLSPRWNPQGPSKGVTKVIRSASWFPHVYDVRATNRADYYPLNAGPDLGFRCAFNG
jgi:formylglycine-generating enzyme required for sulfatase activity